MDSLLEALSNGSESEDDAPRPALPLPPVDTLPTDEDGPPTTAEQYLAQVRREAAAMPPVFVSRLRPPSPPPAKPAPHRLRLPNTPIHLLPDARWQDGLVRGFADFQRSLSARRLSGVYEAKGIPAKGETAKWKEIIMGHSQVKPAMQFFMALDYTEVVEALAACDSVLAAHGFGDEHGLKKFTPWTTETVMMWSSNVVIFENTLWFLFQLLVVLVPPVGGGTAAVIRSILRKIVIGRLHCDPHTYRFQDDFDDMDWNRNLAKTNVVITVLEKYFRQGDAPT